MKSFFIFLFLVILAGTGLYWYYVSGPYSKGVQRTFFGKEESMTLKSIFTNGKDIPTKYTCDGEDVNPPFTFSAIPIDTKSLAIIVEDPDSKPKNFTHWVIFNIHPSLNGLEENSVPDGAVQGINDFSNTFYGGPCPTDGKHRYIFKLYALNMFLSLNKGSTKLEVQKAMENHILDEAELNGTYQKSSQ